MKKDTTVINVIYFMKYKEWRLKRGLTGKLSQSNNYQVSLINAKKYISCYKIPENTMVIDKNCEICI